MRRHKSRGLRGDAGVCLAFITRLVMVWALTVIPLLAQAVGDGSWQASAMGVTLSQRGEVAESAPLTAADAVQGVITQVVWRYTLTRPAPAGLLVRLCTASRCVDLPGATGSTRDFSGVPASEPLYFIWQVAGQGRLFPAVHVLSNQVIVNYRLPVN